MANGENNPTTGQQQPVQQPSAAELWARGVKDSWNRPLHYTPIMMMDDDERPSLDFYDQEIEKLTSNDQYYKVRDEANKRAIEMLIRQSGKEPNVFFEQNPDGTPLEAIKFANFDGFNDKAERYKRDISVESGYNKVMEELEQEYMSRYISSYLSPEMAPGINEMLPDYIKDNKERQADFEEAFRQQWGVGIDFNDSGRVSDVKADTWIGDFANWVGRDLLNDVPLLIADGVAGLSNTIYDAFSSGGLEEADKEFREKVESGEVPTLESYQALRQTGEVGFLEDFFNNPYGTAALYSTEAREMYLQSTLSPRRDINFQKFMDRDDSTAGDVLSLGVGELIKSAPLLLDIYSGMGASKAILKKAGQRAIAKKVGQRTIRTRGAGKTTQFFDPSNPMRTLKKDYATDILERGTELHRLIENTSGAILSSTLVAGQMHADLVGEEWYDNLSASERAWYLANQSGAEVMSGIVLGNIMGGKTLLGRLSKSKITQNVIKNQRSAIMEWGKQAAKNVVFGITEEAASEAATAAWQYVSEVNTRINSGDRTAYYSNDELWKRVKEAAVAGAVMGLPAGFVGGTIRPGAEAFVANFHNNKLQSNKDLKAAVDRVDKARTKTEKKSALQALEEEIQNNSAVSGSIARAYHRMKQANPELFDKVVGLQDKVNVLVEKYKKANTPEQQAKIRQQIKAAIEEKQKLENDAFEGDTTFESVVKEEFEKTMDKRYSLGRKFKQSMESDPDVLADRAIKEEKDAQKASLEAAERANSAEQNADDDAQDQQGTTEDTRPKRNPNYKAKPGERVTAKPGGTLAEGASNNPKYKTLRGTTNFFLKAFKRLGVSVVMHSTQESYTAATGNTSKGTFTKGKVVHINMAAENTNKKTVRHEFYHAAYLTIDPKVKKQRLEELKRLLYTYVGKDTVDQLIEDIKREYTDPSKGPVYSPEKLVEETFVTLLERFADRIPIREESGLTKFGRGLANILRRLFGYSAKEAEVMVQGSELKQFIANFRAAERTGREFTGEQLSEAADIESRDINIVVRDAAEAKRIGDRISDRLGIENIDDYPGDPNLKSQAGKHYLVFTPDGLNTFSKEDIQRIQKEAELVTRRKMKVGKSSPQEMSTRRPASADMESRDFGMRQPSKAYPDLINKKVTWTYYFVSQYGKARSIPSEGMVFNDYWHFRNWYLKETGNGKMANNIGQFRYLGDDGKYRTINPPKPRRDRETGEIIDMEPRLKSPERRQLDANERDAKRRSRRLRYAEIRKNAGSALKFAVGKIEKIDKTGELAFYDSNMLVEQESRSELPVAYKETFYVDGLNVNQLDELGTAFGDNLEFAFPTRMEADFEFTVTNNGDGTVTIEAHTEAKPVANAIDLNPDQSVDGEIDMEQREVADLSEGDLNSLMDLIGRVLPVESLRQANGMRIVTVFYDPTTGGRSGIGADFEKGYLFSQSEEEGAEKTLGAIQRASIADVDKRVKETKDSGKLERFTEGREVDENGRVTYTGRILLGTGLMKASSLYGNSDFMGLIRDQYVLYLDRLGQALGRENANGMFVDEFANFMRDRLRTKEGDAELSMLVSLSKAYNLLDDTKNFSRVATGRGAADTGFIAMPKTAEGVLIMLDTLQKSQSEDFKNVKRQFRSKASFMKAMISGDKSFSSRIESPEVKEDLLPTPNKMLSEMKNRAMLSGDKQTLDDLSQKLGYFKVFEYVVEEVDGLRGKERRLVNAVIEKQETEDGDDAPFSWAVKVTNGTFNEETRSYDSEDGGGLLSEFVSQEDLELVDIMSKYAPTYGKMSDLMKKYGSENIGDTAEAIEARINELRTEQSQWIKDNLTEEINNVASEVGQLDKIISDTKNKTPKERSKAADKKKKFVNPKTKNEAYKKFQELYNITQKIEQSKKDLATQKQAERGMQNAAAPGEINVKEKLTEEATRDNRVTEGVDGMESRELSSDAESSEGWQPNNMNSFQAFMARVDQLFANKYANVFSLQRAIEGAQKAVVDISQDFINAETLLYGKTANDLEKLDDKVKVISQEMKSSGLTSEDVSDYLIARHAEERNALIAERTEGEMIDGSGMSNERAQEVMDSFSPEKKAALESISKKVDEITASTRKAMVNFGLESQETIDAFEDMFEFYVPLGGLSADEMSADTSLYPTGGAGMSIYGDTTRRARGRKSQANNVLAQAIAQNAAVHAKGRKNEALSSLYNLVENNPNSNVWKITGDVPFDAQGAVGVRVNGEQKFIVFTNPDYAKALKNMGVEKLDVFSKVMRSFSGFLRRSFTTANPEFIISNFARDIQSALFNAMAEADIPGGQIESKYIATKVIERVKETLPALLKGAVGKDLSPEVAAYFEEFKEDGGQTGWGFVKDVGTIAAEIEAEVNEKTKLQKAGEWAQKNSIEIIENVNDAFENSIRLAAYIEARESGASREKAAELAKNITVNFNRSGELGAIANAWYMFFNASVQGTVRLARSLGTLKDVRKPDGELEAWHNRLNGAQKMAFGLSLITGMLTAINLGMSDEDEDGVLFYNKIPDYEKERNLIIMYDGQNYLKIPLPYGFNVFANMGSAMAEVAGGQRDMTDAGMFILNSAFSSFSPVSFGQSKDAAKYLAKGATPTIFKPLVDIAVNESYFGSSVYKPQFPVGAPKPEAEMSFRSPEGVRKFFQWMNEATGGSEFVPGKADFNPDKFWYGFEYYIGGAGQFVTRTLGTGRDAYEMIKEGEKVPMKANDFPFLRKLYGEFSKYYDSDVYVENANLVSQLYKERKEADNKNDKRYRGIMNLESARKRTEKQIKRLRELRKEARDIENYVERQNRIYELYEKERSLLMQFNKQFEQLRGQN